MCECMNAYMRASTGGEFAGNLEIWITRGLPENEALVIQLDYPRMWQIHPLEYTSIYACMHLCVYMSMSACVRMRVCTQFPEIWGRRNLLVISNETCMYPEKKRTVIVIFRNVLENVITEVSCSNMFLFT